MDKVNAALAYAEIPRYGAAIGGLTDTSPKQGRPRTWVAAIVITRQRIRRKELIHPRNPPALDSCQPQQRGDDRKQGGGALVHWSSSV